MPQEMMQRILEENERLRGDLERLKEIDLQDTRRPSVPLGGGASRGWKETPPAPMPGLLERFRQMLPNLRGWGVGGAEAAETSPASGSPTGMTNLPPGLAPQSIERFVTANPGATPEDAIREWLLMKSEEEGKTFGQKLQEWAEGLPRDVAGAMTESVTGLLSLPQIVAGGLRGQPPSKEELVAGLPGQVARGIVPQTPTQQALALSAGPISRIAPLTGIWSLLNPAARVGASTAVGAVTGALTEEGVKSGAIQGSVGGGVGELARGVIRAMQLSRSVMTRPQRLKLVESDARATLQGILEDAPDLMGATVGGARRGGTSSDSLWSIATGGKKAARQGFARIDAEVTSALGGPKKMIRVPAAAIRHGILPHEVPEITVEQALKELKLATADAIDAAQGASGYAVRSNARSIREQIVTAIHNVNPELAARYSQRATEYMRNLRIVDALIRSETFLGETRSGMGATFDLPKFFEYLTKHADDLGQQVLPSTWRYGLQGGAPGAARSVQEANPLRVYFGSGVSTMTGKGTKFIRNPLGPPVPLPGVGMFPPISSYLGSRASELGGLTVNP